MPDLKIPEVKRLIDNAIGVIKTNALKALEIEAVRSIQKNFEAGGRPKWISSKKKGKLKGTKTLRVSGALSEVSAVRDDNAGTVTLITSPDARAYARIHQEGGTINHPGGSRARRKKRDGKSVFAKKNRDTGRANKVDVSFSKPYKIIIPPRPYLVIPKEDHQGIINAVVSRIKGALM